MRFGGIGHYAPTERVGDAQASPRVTPDHRAEEFPARNPQQKSSSDRRRKRPDTLQTEKLLTAESPEQTTDPKGDVVADRDDERHFDVKV